MAQFGRIGPNRPVSGRLFRGPQGGEKVENAGHWDSSGRSRRGRCGPLSAAAGNEGCRQDGGKSASRREEPERRVFSAHFIHPFGSDVCPKEYRLIRRRTEGRPSHYDYLIAVPGFGAHSRSAGCRIGPASTGWRGPTPTVSPRSTGCR